MKPGGENLQPELGFIKFEQDSIFILACKHFTALWGQKSLNVNIFTLCWYYHIIFLTVYNFKSLICIRKKLSLTTKNCMKEKICVLFIFFHNKCTLRQETTLYYSGEWCSWEMISSKRAQNPQSVLKAFFIMLIKYRLFIFFLLVYISR